MISKSIQKISLLIAQLRKKFSVEDLDEFVIFGSSAIVLNEKDLGREIDDLDIFVSESSFSKLKIKYSLKEVQKLMNVTYLQVGIPKIEIWSSFPGVTYDEVRKNASQKSQSDGLLVAAIDDLRAWKLTQGRDKDIHDLKKME